MNFYTQSLTFLALKDKCGVSSPTPALSLSGKRCFHPRVCSWPQPSLAFLGFNWELHLTKCPTLPLLWEVVGPTGWGNRFLGPEWAWVCSWCVDSLSSFPQTSGSWLHSSLGKLSEGPTGLACSLISAYSEMSLLPRVEPERLGGGLCTTSVSLRSLESTRLPGPCSSAGQEAALRNCICFI